MLATRAEKMLLIAGVGLVLAVGAVAGLAAFILFNPFGPITGIVLPDREPGAQEGVQRILILGSDARAEEASRSDTIVVTKVDEEGLGMLSVPRDTRTGIPGVGDDKVNHAFAYGGPELAAETVSGLTGTEIEDYVVVSMEGVPEIVDAMGGVEVEVPASIRSEGTVSGRTIALEPGRRTLDGEEALAYLRWRGNDRGDIGRVARQQDFLQQMFHQALRPANLTRLPELRRAMLENVQTNLSNSELFRLASRVRSLQAEGVEQRTATIPGEEATLYSEPAGQDLSFWLPDEPGLREAVERTIR